MTQRPNWTRLNGHVDGELPPQPAADVVDAARVDAGVAEDLALLYRLKGTTQAAFPSAPPDLAAQLPRPPGALPRLRAALAAAALLAACVVGLMTASSLETPPRSDTLLADARALHADWLRAEMASPEVSSPATLDALTRFGKLPVVPDLSATGLSIGMVAVHRAAGDRVLQIGYRGHHGCHLSLFVISGDGVAPDARPDAALNEELHAWRVADLGYLLIADAMDRSRFDLIARTVEAATRARSPLTDRDRRLLASNKRASSQCAA